MKPLEHWEQPLPTYHLAVVIGGTSAEANLKTVKAASTRGLDHLPDKGDGLGAGYRDREWEDIILGITRDLGTGHNLAENISAMMFALSDAAAWGILPCEIGVSCSAIGRRWQKSLRMAFSEKLEHDPARFLPSSLWIR